MGAWRRPFCTSARRDPELEAASTPTKRSSSPRIRAKFAGLFPGSGSNASTPKLQPVNTPSLRCRTTPNSPKLTAAVKEAIPARLLKSLSEPSSPRSPSKFALLKATLCLSRNRCGVCTQNLKAGDGSAAIFTAECSHTFHLSCITSRGSLVCPVCSATWRSSPLLSSVSPLSVVAEHRKETTRRLRDAEPRSPAAVAKIYDDDEPLVSAGANSLLFDSIPEEDEDEDHHHHHSPSPGGVEVCVVQEVALVSAGRSHRNYVVAMKVKAPTEFREGRAPIDLVTVLDVRGSMTVGKLHMLKRAMRQLIASLGSGDRLSIVAFSSTAAKRLLSLHRMSRQGQRAAAQVVDRLLLSPAQSAGGGAGDALRKAAKVLEDRRERNPVATVMLLSDAAQQQSKGSDRDGRFSHVEVPIGEESSKCAEDPFMQCVVGGLLSVVMREVYLHIVFPGGDVSSVYSCGGGSGRAAALGGGSTVRLGDLRAGEERMLLVEVRVSAAAVDRNHGLFVRCSYRGGAAQAVIRCEEQPLPLPPLQGRLESSYGVQRLRNLFVGTRAVAESRRLAELCDLGTAMHLLSSARTLLLQSASVDKKLLFSVEAELADLQQRRQHSQSGPLSRGHSTVSSDDGREALTPTSAWRAAERLAKLAMMRKSMNRVSDLHGFENARF